MTRRNLIATGLSGVIGAVLITSVSLFIMLAGWIPALIRQPVYVWALFLFLLVFSLAEIPVMIFGMRRIVDSVNPKAKYAAMLTNAGYTLFAGVYAAPFILLAGQSWLELSAGGLLGALTFIRFFSSLMMVPYAR